MKSAALTSSLTAFLLAAGLSDAASSDLLKGIASDGVFVQVRPLPQDRVLKGERGYELMPGQFGGQWSVVLGGAQNAASSVRFTFLGGTDALAKSGPTIGKLLGRMVGRAATSCFNIGTERLPALQSWLTDTVKTGQPVNLERSFGALRVQLLIALSGSSEIDVLLSRSGAPGSAAWASTCQK
ncbi:hypothetical protein [Deinococcus ruber]|uniref:Outer membrane lipoprotein carrier protein LolA n=1 Tax=Deinococcus ruber TaxID=1848197 RepID=A0A918C3Q0_9DEIO|nr:hypothetical protein [Deinococcus ruber]GGR05316.1 hypothetical protein GCM10008957_17820 [Deinococcus ruber]